MLRHKIFHERIKKNREAQGISRKDLAEWARMTYQRLGNIERGEGRPTLDELLNISMALEMRMYEFFYGDDELLPIGEHWPRNQGLIRDIVTRLLSYENFVDEQWVEYCNKYLLPYFDKLMKNNEVPEITKKNAPDPPWNIKDI